MGRVVQRRGYKRGDLSFLRASRAGAGGPPPRRPRAPVDLIRCYVAWGANLKARLNLLSAGWLRKDCSEDRHAARDN